jgi:hypothetical protein
MNMVGMAAVVCIALWGQGPVLEISGTSFTLDGRRTFLLGISYYGALGIEEPTFVEQDLADLSKYGFNWIRVWATWDFDGYDVSAVAPDGSVRQPYMRRLEELCTKAGQRGIVVDVTVTRGEGPSFPATLRQHKAVIATLADRMKPFRNVYFDVANERNVGDRRHVPMAEVGELIDAVKRIDPKRPGTASQGGDIPAAEVLSYIAVGKVDFLCPHRPRNRTSAQNTQARTREYLDAMKSAPRIVPVHYQEPFRRGYGAWAPVAADFVADLRGAREGGAAGWCFHNGASRGAAHQRPRRSFDMRPAEGRLFAQLDAEERAFLEQLRSQRH